VGPAEAEAAAGAADSRRRIRWQDRGYTLVVNGRKTRTFPEISNLQMDCVAACGLFLKTFMTAVKSFTTG
tara:strand:+ start:20738 stop:20947 length:210 start_codon:yes stop_codon:yes gene_type:complete